MKKGIGAALIGRAKEEAAARCWPAHGRACCSRCDCHGGDLG
ncbi:MAG TPA: hypothetical protein VFW50_37140 [Streptosporangiaceae bacterium]|nr:hypothetical protein [Streptosporangiaceae bacterium]